MAYEPHLHAASIEDWQLEQTPEPPRAGAGCASCAAMPATATGL